MRKSKLSQEVIENTGDIRSVTWYAERGKRDVELASRPYYWLSAVGCQLPGARVYLKSLPVGGG